MTACPHGYPKRSNCLTCMEDGPVADPPRWRPVGERFRAQYASWCRCGEQIVQGDRVQRWDLGDEQTVYTHEGCAP